MKVDAKLVTHIAGLGNLSLTPDEVRLFVKQLKEILSYVETLSRVKTDQVRPTYQVLDKTVNVWREDKPGPKCFSQKQALSQAKKTHQGYFVADHVFSPKNQLKSGTVIKRPKLDKYNAALTIVNPKGDLGVKDLFCTQGIETTAGSAVLNGFKPQYSATAILKLEQAGMVIKSKLNLDAWGHGSSGENSDFGPTGNPWDKSRVAGGSSSGSGAAVSTGEAEVATGTDTCGSIRMPSSFCNVCGIKPSYGAVSRYGVIAFASSLDCPGLIARSVNKLARTYKITAGKDEHDCTSQSRLREKIPAKPVKTIGLAQEFFGLGLNPEVRRLVLTAADKLKQQGYKIKNVSLPHSKYGIAAYYLIAPTETCSNLARFDGIRYGLDRSYFGAEAKRRIMIGAFAASAGYSAKYYAKAAKIRSLIIQDFERVFKQVEALIGPVAPMPPFKLGENTADPLKMYLADIYAAPASLAGLPSLAIPCGFTKNNLPVGLQLFGPRWSEAALFDVGEVYQQLTDWHKRTPKL